MHSELDANFFLISFETAGDPPSPKLRRTEWTAFLAECAEVCQHYFSILRRLMAGRAPLRDSRQNITKEKDLLLLRPKNFLTFVSSRHESVVREVKTKSSRDRYSNHEKAGVVESAVLSEEPVNSAR